MRLSSRALAHEIARLAVRRGAPSAAPPGILGGGRPSPANRTAREKLTNERVVTLRKPPRNWAAVFKQWSGCDWAARRRKRGERAPVA